MTPAARVAAAIEVLDTAQSGVPVEQALTRWARSHRFAGSKDRAAIRDHVFDVMRCKRSAAAIGGGEDGRRLMLGIFRLQGADVDAFFSGEGYGPPRLSSAEAAHPEGELSEAEAWNLPDWLVPHFKESLGENAKQAALLLQERAPVTLRVNTAKTSTSDAKSLLSGEGIDTESHPDVKTALRIVAGSRKLRGSRSYLDGYVELQDASSQAFIADIPDGVRVLDYCAGGGGKSLALAAQPGRVVFAHDHDPGRMRDIAPRAKRAGADIRVLGPQELGQEAPFDIVMCDAPCSGSGAWRRSPEAKWRLTEAGLADLNKTQDEILSKAARLTADGGTLIYATCSLLRVENEARIERFLLGNSEWRCRFSRRYPLSEGADGFFAAHLTR